MRVCLCLKLWRVFGISDSHVSKSLRHIQHSKFMSSCPFPHAPPVPVIVLSSLLPGLGVAGSGSGDSENTLKQKL